MTEKRFMVDDCGTLIDMTNRNTYDYVSDVVELLNALHEENINLKQALWEAEVNYYGERCDNILDYEGWIEDLKEDWDREYWNE